MASYSSSDARTSGESTPLGSAEELSRGSQLAAHDSTGDTMGNRDDFVPGATGQMSAC